MAKSRKRVTMTVTVSCPRWLTAAQARKEVRTLINEQCFYGHTGRNSDRQFWDEVGEDNFRAVSVKSGGAA